MRKFHVVPAIATRHNFATRQRDISLRGGGTKFRMIFKVDSLDKIDPPLSTQCRVVALPTRQRDISLRGGDKLQQFSEYLQGGQSG